MAFGDDGDDGAKAYFYDFATGESVDTLPDGAAQVPGVDADLLPTYDVATLGMSPEMPGALAFQRPLVRPDLVRSLHLTPANVTPGQRRLSRTAPAVVRRTSGRNVRDRSHRLQPRAHRVAGNLRRRSI
jgi:hypothetical protein